jgi:mycothiol synthase
VLITEVNGEPACYSRVFWLAQDGERGESLRIYRSVTFMHPAWRRKGLGRAILPYNERRMREIAAGHPAEMAKFFEVTVPDANVGALALLKQSGYLVIRHFFIMSSDLSGDISTAPMPAGLELRPAKPEHYRKIWDAIEEAFIDHWGFTPRNDEDYQRWLEHPEFDPTLWAVAWESDQVAGAAINLISENENDRLGRDWAWTEPIAVRRPWRQRGLGRALLLESQRVMKARGMQGAALEVDAENPNKALHLYESCGYRTRRRWDLHRKALK